MKTEKSVAPCHECRFYIRTQAQYAENRRFGMHVTAFQSHNNYVLRVVWLFVRTKVNFICHNVHVQSTPMRAENLTPFTAPWPGLQKHRLANAMERRKLGTIMSAPLALLAHTGTRSRPLRPHTGLLQPITITRLY